MNNEVAEIASPVHDPSANLMVMTMLFYLTRYVIRKQELAKDSTEEEDEMGEGTVDDTL